MYAIAYTTGLCVVKINVPDNIVHGGHVTVCIEMFRKCMETVRHIEVLPPTGFISIHYRDT